MPRSWARASPSPTSVASSRLRVVGSGPRASRSLSFSPRMSSMTMKVTSSTSSISKMTAMWGWSRAATACASCKKRLRRSGSATKSGGRTLRATSG